MNALLEHNIAIADASGLITEIATKCLMVGSVYGMGVVNKGMIQVPEKMKQKVQDSIMLLRTVYNLKIMNCLFLGLSI